MFGSLDASSWDHPIVLFASDRYLTRDYIDNSWVRVALDADTLKQFLQLGADKFEAAREMIFRINADRWYVVTEEEF